MCVAGSASPAVFTPPDPGVNVPSGSPPLWLFGYISLACLSKPRQNSQAPSVSGCLSLSPACISVNGNTSLLCPQCVLDCPPLSFVCLLISVFICVAECVSLSHTWGRGVGGASLQASKHLPLSEGLSLE